MTTLRATGISAMDFTITGVTGLQATRTVMVWATLPGDSGKMQITMTVPEAQALLAQLTEACEDLKQ